MFPYYEEKLKFDPYDIIIKYSNEIFNKNYNLNISLILDKDILLNFKQPQETH